MPPDMPQASPLQPTQDDLTLVDILLFVRRRWLVIFAPALVAAAVAAVIAATRAPVYQSTATLDVPSEVKPELKRFLPTPQAYLLVLESPTTKKELARRLEAKGVLPANAQYVLRTRLTAATPPAMLEATAEAPTAELPAAIVEEWVELFQERIRRIVDDAARAKDQSVKAKLAKLREQETTIEADFARKLDDIVVRFEKKCGEHRQQTEDLLLVEDIATTDAIVAYETETEKLLREPDFKNSSACMRLQLDALRKTYSTLQEEQANATFQVPQPDGAPARLQQLAQALGGCGEKLQALTLKLQEEQAKRDALERARVAGLRKLKDERAARRAKLSGLRDTQLASLEQQRDELVRSLSQSKGARLRSLYSNMAAQQKAIDELGVESPSDPQQEARVLVPAVAPAQPQSLGLTKYVLLGLFGGVLLGVALALVLEAGVRAFQRNQATTSPTPLQGT